MVKSTRVPAAPSLLNQLAVPSIIDPLLFLSIEQLARSAITFGGNHTSVRGDVARVIIELRRLAMVQVGHDSIEVTNLVQLMKRTDPAKKETHERPEAELDPILALELRRELSPQQSAAAQMIRAVWNAFSRGLAVAPRSMEKLGSHKRSRPQHPMDIMGKRVYEIWQNHYRPWYEEAKYRRVNRRTTGTVSAVSIVQAILVEGHQPRTVDSGYRLDDHAAEKCLKFELEQFWAKDNR